MQMRAGHARALLQSNLANPDESEHSFSGKKTKKPGAAPGVILLVKTLD